LKTTLYFCFEENRFYSLKGGPHLSVTSLLFHFPVLTSSDGTRPLFRRSALRRKLRRPRRLRERDALVDGALRSLEAADRGASGKEATRRRIWRFLAKMVTSTVSTQTMSQCLNAFHFADLPIIQLPTVTNPFCALTITVDYRKMFFLRL